MDLLVDLVEVLVLAPEEGLLVHAPAARAHDLGVVDRPPPQRPEPRVPSPRELQGLEAGPAGVVVVELEVALEKLAKISF